jgi:6-methylsalicylate decarboxylase
MTSADPARTPLVDVPAQVNSIDAAPQPDGDTWRALTTRNAQRLFPA